MFDIVKNKWIFLGLSIALVVISIASLFIVGLNLDVDFTGGTTMYVNIGKEFDNNEISSIVEEAVGTKPSSVQKSGDAGTEVVIKIRSLDTEERAKMFDAIKEKYSLEQEALLQVDNVNATVGSELKRSAIMSAVIAIILMLVYISFRFEFWSGIAAVLSLAQNVLILLGVYSIFKLPINTTFIAAILTIVGYSINDTIVIFDRIREDSRFMKKKPFSEVVNSGIWKSITRSINTSVTTLLTIVILAIVGVPAIKEFALPIIIGICVGTFSSIFIASPIWALIKGDGKLAASK